MNDRALPADAVPTTAAPAAPAEPHWELGPIVDQLRQVRTGWRQARLRNHECGGREFPSRQRLREILQQFCAALFPMRLGPADLRLESEDFFVGHTLDIALSGLHEQVRRELAYNARHDPQRGAGATEQRAIDIVQQFARALPAIRSRLDTDVEAAYHGDPAALSVDEVLLCYPGILAIIYHRLAHTLYRLGVPLVARIVAELAHSETGIDIHPGASIGGSFFIDHGTGVVIGETAVIGERVRIYQAVTLGAKRFPAGADGTLQKGLPRHPLVEDDVVIYAGATILGRVTIGRGSVIGGNVWLTRGVPPGSNITQASSRHEEAAPPAAPSGSASC
ncbi:MAG: serine O-acetyltransferase EpsC [Pseudomonadota bacterium]